MGKTVVVVDGMGGGIGVQLVARIRKEIKADIQLLALATNAVAVGRMVDAGASRGASGENAFRVTLPEADVVLGPLGIVLPNAMMGELTPAMAEAVFACRARKILLPLAQTHLVVVGMAERNVGELVEESVAALAKLLPE